MDARTLVGMTMGARKRAARAQYMYATYAIFDARRDVIRIFGHTNDGLSAEYKRHAAMYRIGHRLRPCPGCPNCNSLLQDQQIDGRWIPGRAVLHDRNCSNDDPSGARCMAITVDVIGKCKASGVIPAKARKVLR